jgi:tripartite-type tricarboxylate transporter receptor subunit TctC
MKTIVKLAGAALLALAALVAPAGAQDYPNKPIRLIVPYPPGGGVDICARILAELLGAKLGQPMIVENKPGATSTIGVEFVAKSAPDGYTLLATNSDGMTIVPNVKRTVPYSVPKDFTFISRLLLVPLTVSVYSGVPAKNMTEFIAYAKANPGKLRYGTSGVGSGPHFAALLLEKAAGLKMVHVPYKGSGPNIQDLMGGHIDLSLNAVQAIVPVVSSGKDPDARANQSHARSVRARRAHDDGDRPARRDARHHVRPRRSGRHAGGGNGEAAPRYRCGAQQPRGQGEVPSRRFSAEPARRRRVREVRHGRVPHDEGYR